MRLIGLTGGVATGKSLAARLFAQRGATILSADTVAHRLTAPGMPLVHEIGNELGSRFTHDGVLNRSALGEYVFNDPDARRKLESIIHPHVMRELRRRIRALRNRKTPPEVVVVEVPLLFEVGMEDWFDEVVTVISSEDDQISRMRDRDGLDESAARARVRAQMPLEEKAARADHVIVNSGPVADLESQVDAIMANSARGNLSRTAKYHLETA